MGTTVTTNLGLIKPDGAESIKANMPTFAGWAAQNAANMDKIDTLFRSSNSTYTPVWSAGGTPVVLGSGGFVEGKWLRIFPRLVIVYYRVLTGAAGFVPGTGQYRLTLPFLPASELLGLFDSPPCGKSILLDNDTVNLSSCMVAVLSTSTPGSLSFRDAGGNFFAPTVPTTLAQNDRFSGYCMYPTSDA